MNQVEKTIHQAEQKCRRLGVRLTDKRKLVLSGLLTSGKALSAYELVDLCKEEFGKSIPVMSVYRILKFLQQNQFAHKLNLANKYIACCHIACDHSHEVPQFLICEKCQRVKEISVGKITEKELRQDVETAGFQLVTPQLEIHCVCGQCIDKES